ncbi:MAG: hypothetical protein O2959_00905 [Proteobacteria bacterium]|nr:hypothetical protein [Pseudomonadota bacterium]MDA1034092.1 hypothetical protein [Pseudomonadota bacterium]
MKDTYLSVKEITNSLKVNKETLKQWINEGKFPPPLKVNDRVTIWSYAVIENWVAQQQQTFEWLENQDLDF